MNKIYLTQTLSLKKEGDEFKGDISGVAYTGAVIPEHGWVKNLVIDLSTLKVAKEKTPILRDHITSQVAGHSKVDISEKEVTFTGKLSKKSKFGIEIMEMADDEFDWEMSLGVYGGRLLEIEKQTINGHYIESGTVLKDGLVREISVVALGADKDTSAQVFKLDNEGEFKPMLTKEQWIKLACACGGSDKTTPEELETKFAEGEEKAAELQKEIDALKSQIAAKQAEIDKLKEDGEVESREAELKSAIDAKGIELAEEKIKEAAKTKEKTEMLLSVIADMKKQETVPAHMRGKTDLGQSIKPEDTDKIRLQAEELVKEGKAKNFLEALSLVEVK